MTIRVLLLSVALFLSCGQVWAARAPMVFERLGLEHGLSQGTINDIHQDSQGFIWIATENGLNRYDGYEFKLYSRERGNPDGLGSDYVWAIEEDSDGNLWLATEGGGVVRWIRDEDRFQSYRHDVTNQSSLSSDFVRNLIIDRSGRIWVATRNEGLNLLDPQTGTVTRYMHDADNSSTISSNTLFALLEDKEGNIWLGTDKGLDRYSIRDKGFERLQQFSVLHEQRVFSLTQDRRGDIWIGTFETGLYRLNTESDKVTVYRHDTGNSASLSSDNVRAVFEDDEKRLWIGTDKGLNLFDRIDGSFTRYQRESGNPNSLSANYIMSVYQDAGGLLWVGTRSGINHWNPRSWSFGHQFPDWLDGAYVLSFADNKSGELWVGSVGADLSRVDLSTGERTLFGDIASNPEALADQRVMSLLYDSYEQLWIGTMTGGLSRMDANGVVTTFQHDPEDNSTISANGIMSLYEDSSGGIWVGTFGGGVSYFDQESNTFQRTFGAIRLAKPLGSMRATSIVEDDHGYIWVGTDGDGLVLLDRLRGVIRQYRHDPKDQTTLSSNTIFSLHIDDNDQIWVGTAGGGLDRVVGGSEQAAQIEFANFSQGQGLPNNVIYGIRSDDAGKLWLSTNHGLTRFDPLTMEVKAFHTSHGLQGEEFNSGSHHKMRDGKLVFGGMNGFNAFNPHKLQESRVEPRIVLTGFELLNEAAATEHSLSTQSSFDLHHKDDVVTFEFAALDFTDPSRNQYAYKLEGFDEDFVNIGNLRRVTYTNLDAGSYVFRVRAASADSVWNEQGLAIPVQVRAAPWATPWAYTSYIAALLGIAFLIFRSQHKRLRQEERYRRRLAREVRNRTEELNQRNQQLKEASEAKSNFLARMSHEIRTPMNGVIGMTELLRSTDLSKKQMHYTQTISRSAGSLLQIINDVLDLSKIEAGHFDLEALPLDMSDIVDDTVALLAREAAKKGIEFTGFVDPRLSLELIGDPLRIRQVLINLAGNAIKFTDEGEVSIRVSCDAIDRDQAMVRLEVADTGLGIEDEALERIFDAFSQADESTTRQFGGTGLGLSICKQLVELMSGEMSVSSTPNVGSVFTCVIPFALAPSQICRDSIELSEMNVIVATPLRSLRDTISRNIAAHEVHVYMAESSDELDRLLDSDDDTFAAMIIDSDSMDPDRVVEILDSKPDNTATRLFLSSHPDMLNEVDMLRPESKDRIITKPVHWSVLFESLQSVYEQQEQTGEAPERVSARSIAPLRGRVLVVEDNKVNQLVAEGMLRELGCQATIVSDGRAGVARATSEKFDIVLMDAQMPGMDGFEATRLIRNREEGRSHLPIIGVTAHASADGRNACLAAGMDDYLSKPYVLEDLAAVIKKWSRAVIQPEQTAANDSSMAEGGNVYHLDAATLNGIRSLQTEDRPDLLDRIFATYLDGSRTQMRELSVARKAGSLSKMRTIAHALKSSSGNIGAMEFSKLASELEKACDEQDEHSARDLAERMETTYHCVVDAVEDNLGAKSA